MKSKIKKIKKKTHSGAKKRFKLLKGGLIKFTKAGRRHLLTKKSPQSKRSMRTAGYLTSSDIHHLRPIL